MSESRIRTMSYPYYNFKNRYSHYRGKEQAEQHIREAEEFTREVGGSDQDVKEYFFSLPSEELGVIFNLYEEKNGWKAREYAEDTMDRWRSGRTRMSGMVAKRLFELLPPRMPLRDKYRLTEKLWQHVGPSSRKSLRYGIDVRVEDVVGAVRDHIEQVVIAYLIPKDLEDRFNWLAAEDVQMKQKLLSNLQQMEVELVVSGVRKQLPVMLRHLRMNKDRDVHRMAQVLKIGKHELELSFDKDADDFGLEVSAPRRHAAAGGECRIDANGVELEDSAPVVAPVGANKGLWWICVGGAVLVFLIAYVYAWLSWSL